MKSACRGRGTAIPKRRVYDNCIEQAILADKLGFDYCWAVEHHFLEEYSHCSAPEIFLTAIAAQTKRIRVGHGINVCVPEINPAIRIAERCAVLDIVSGGRLEVGTGRSATWTELGGFGANPDTTKATWDEYVRVLPKMWTQERFGYQGTYFSMPERAVLPKPYQKPHPPMWVAVTSPGTELDAAQRGMGALGLTFGSFAEQERKVKAYKDIVRQCEPVGAFVNDTCAAVNFLYCHENPRRSEGDRHAHDRHVRLSRGATRVGARGLCVAVVCELRSAAAGAPPGECARDSGRDAARHVHRRSGHADRYVETVGKHRRRLRELPVERVGDGAATGGAREPRTVCAQSDAEVRHDRRAPA